MALVNLIGFDHFKTIPLASASSANNTIISGVLTSLASGLCAGPSLDSTPIGSSIQLNGNYVIQEVTLSNGKVRKFLCTGSQNTYARYYLSAAQLTAIPKNGKWLFGCRVYYGSGPSSSGAGTVLSLRVGSAQVPVVTVTAPGVYFVEAEIDWVNLTVKIWLNGVLQNTYSGSNYVAASYTSMFLYAGAYTNFNVTGFIAGFTDSYFLVEEASEVGTLSRLGPVIVKPQAWATAENVGRFTPPGSLSVLDQFNANNSVGNAATDYAYGSNNIQTSPHGEIATLTATQPNETQQIMAVTVTTLTHKLTQAAAGTTQQIKQGSNQTTADKTVPGLVTAPTRKSFGFLKALDGTAWSNEKVGQVKLNIGSYRP